MAQQYKRKRIKTGPNSWINITQRQDGTTSRSVSNRAGNTTTNISSKGVRRTQNNSGMVQRSFWSYKPKKPRKPKTSSFSWFFGSSSKKSTPKKKEPFNSDKFMSNVDRLDKQLGKKDIDKLTPGEQRIGLLALFIIILIIQLTIKSCS